MKRVVGCLAVSLLAFASRGSTVAQAQQAKPPVPLTTGMSILSAPAASGGQFHVLHAYMSILTKRMEALRMREMNADRHKHLESETNRLVDLVTDLDKKMRDGKELTPPDLNRRAAEIERLAHSVQERMKG